MATVNRPAPPDLDRGDAPNAPLLWDGQELDQETFHQLYLQMPEDFRAELIDGIVYVTTMPLSPAHGRNDSAAGALLYLYSAATPGTHSQVNTTTKLGPRSEVQPDCVLLLDHQWGGRSGEDATGYTTGGPELVIEVSVSTLALDLNAKKRVYEQAGVREYVVTDLPHKIIHWFEIREGRFEPLACDPDGLFRSRVFPGLWIDPAAFWRDDKVALIATMQRGLASPEHAAFVAELERRRAARGVQ